MLYAVDKYRSIVNIIEVLNEKGIDIVFIDSHFYVVGGYGTFEPADNETLLFHQLRGINITKYLEARQGAQRITDDDFRVFEQEISARKAYQRQFNKDTNYVWFQSYR